MSSEDTIEERQNYELQALKSIFESDLRDLRGKAVWNQWMPLNLVITITPQQSSSRPTDHVKINLHVVCSRNYPNEVPQLLLENPKGLSKKEVDELKKELKVKAKELLGEVMIYELVQIIQAFLYKHNRPPLKSFYDQMLMRQKQIKEQKEQAIKQKQAREHEEIEKKFMERKKILKIEKRYRRERMSVDCSTSSSPSDVSRSFSFTRNDFIESEIEMCKHKGPSTIDFSNNRSFQIQTIGCLNHPHENGFIQYHAVDIKTEILFILTQFEIQIKEGDYSQLQKSLSNIEQEINYLVKLSSSHLLHYIDITHYVNEESDSVIVYVLQENILGVTLTSVYNGFHPFSENSISYICKGILFALEFLHRNNVIHRDLNSSNVYINAQGFIQVSNYSIFKRLSDLELQNLSNNKYSKKIDICKFGTIINFLITGKCTSEEDLSLPASCSPFLKDFFMKCTNKDEKERFTATQLLNHPFLQISLERMIIQNCAMENTNCEDQYPEFPITSIKTLTRNDQPRIQRDFEIIQTIGKGAYGHVLEVRNKIDGNRYAVKQIELNPRNKHLNRKMTREVTLLSKLNHENVVRYYNAWIESAVLEKDSDNLLKSNTSVPETIQIKKDNLELNSQETDWSVNYGSKSNIKTEDNSTDEEDWGEILRDSDSDSDSIQFLRESEHSSNKEESTNSENLEDIQKSKNYPNPNMYEIQFMYIQMEFCEKSTLRTQIDNGLHVNVTRVRQLFREIIEGLAHIHQQGMIHRDLKPVNIFLDSKGHIKIGDFGLATSIVLKVNETTKEIQDGENLLPIQNTIVDGSLTGQVGTALYSAPELNCGFKTIYTEKVDIYSLGIIYFEMCYKPLSTQMERVRILNDLRSKQIEFPSDFHENELGTQVKLIRWLLNHDVSKRPTSQELLQSELIPQAIFEERKLKETFLKTLRNPQSKYYKYLIASCFEQNITATQDIDYNLGLSFGLPKSLQQFEYIRQTMENICKLHGARYLSTPLLLPNSKYYDGVQSNVKLMAHSGIVVSIPHDLRISFARHVAWNKINCLRRYSIDRVYRERKVFDSHPRELFECAFDIVTPQAGNLMADAEVLLFAHEIVNSFSELKHKNFRIRLTHSSLLQGIFLYYRIKEPYNDIYKIISDTKEGEATKFQLKNHLIKMGLSDNAIKSFFLLIDLEEQFEKIQTNLQVITKKSTYASSLVRQGLEEIKCVIENAKTLGVTFNFVVAPGMIYNILQYSGVMFQVVCDLKKKRRHSSLDILAAGGRYDKMVTYYRNSRWPSSTNKDFTQAAVGISLSLETLLQAIQDETCDTYENENIEILVCSMEGQMHTEKAKILKDLRASGISCSLVETSNFEDLQEKCIYLHVPYVIILNKNKPEIGVLRSWDRNRRLLENHINLNNAVEDFQQTIKLWREKKSEQFTSNTKVDFPPKGTYEVIFIFSTKVSSNVKLKYKQQIKLQLGKIIDHITKPMYILAVNLNSNVVGDIVTNLDLKSEHDFQQSTKIIIELHHQHKKILSDVFREIDNRRSSKANPILVLYNTSDFYLHFL